MVDAVDGGGKGCGDSLKEGRADGTKCQPAHCKPFRRASFLVRDVAINEDNEVEKYGRYSERQRPDCSTSSIEQDQWSWDEMSSDISEFDNVNYLHNDVGVETRGRAAQNIDHELLSRKSCIDLKTSSKLTIILDSQERYSRSEEWRSQSIWVRSMARYAYPGK